MQREITERWGYDKMMTAQRQQLSETEIEKLAAQDAKWSEDQTVEVALKIG